jgi:hypothetical protein
MDTQTKIAPWIIICRLHASLVGLLLLLFANSGICQTTQTPAAPQFADVTRMVVMIEATLDGNVSQGAGLIFALEDRKAYILTANHVVRSASESTNVKVYFISDPDLAVAATVMPRYSTDLDLAVLEADVKALDLQSEKPLPFGLLASDSQALVRGDQVFPMGYPVGMKWMSPIVPDHFDHSDAQYIYFQSNNVKEGYSGGPVCSANWRIVGIVLAVAQAPVVRALPIQVVLRQLKDWDLAVGTIVTPGETSSVSPNIPTPTAESELDTSKMGLKILETQQGKISTTPVAWGGFVPNPTWVQLEATKIQNLPPAKTLFGNRYDFAIGLTLRSGEEIEEPFGNETQFTLHPMRGRDIDNALLRVTMSSFTRQDSATNPQSVSLAKIRQAQPFHLRYTDSVMREVRSITNAQEITMFLQAHEFWPDANSGNDRDVDTPELVKNGIVQDGSVSFDAGDATDHLLFNRNNQDCKGLLWLEPKGSISLTSSARGGNQGSLSMAVRKPVKLFEVLCDKTPTIIRIQADSPGSEATYRMMAISGNTGRHQSNGPVEVWVRSWIDSQRGTITDDEGDALDRSIEIIRKGTDSNTEDLIVALDAAVEPGTKEMDFIQKKYWDALESLVKRHLVEIYAGMAQCCQQSLRVRFVANLLRAEANQSYDRSILKWANQQKGLPDELRTRISAVALANLPN